MSQYNRFSSTLHRARVLLFLIATASALLAQQPWDSSFTADPKAMLAAASAISADKKSDATVFADDVSVKLDDTGRATQTYRMVYRVDTPSGVEHWAALSYRYSPWYQKRPVIKARVITPDGISHDLDFKTLTDVAVKDRSENVFGDDHQYEGPLPAVAVGSIVEQEATIEDTAPFFEGSWSTRIYIGRGAPVLRSHITVQTLTSHPLHYVTRLLPDLKITKTDADGVTTTVFDQGKLDPTDSHNLLPPEIPRWPYVAMTTANSWQELAARYGKRAEQQVRPDEVKSLVAGIKGSQDEILAAVLAKLHANARYTGVEFGEAAIIPQPPSETLKRKYGDCKDKATLLVSMLRAVGIPANLVLLNAGNDQDVEAEVPGMTGFDHAIVYLPTKDLFIDATDEYAHPSDLPSGDQGRLALIIADDTKELHKIPEAASSTNGKIEQRDIFLGETGMARIVESTHWFGPNESALRSSYDGGESKEQRKSLENYVKNMYLAESLTKYEHTDPADLKKPFTLRLEVAKSRRATTELESAVAAIRVLDLVDQRLPDEVLDEEKKEADDTPADQRRTPRTADWYMDSSSVAEWRYTITPPPGFSVRGLPESKTTKFGPAMLSEEYKSGAEGVVYANIRMDTVKRRYTIAEVNQLRDAWKQYKNHGIVLIYFDLTGNKLIQQGNVKQGLVEIRKLAAMHPKEGLHRAQMARAYLSASLGEMARSEAEQAVKLDPKSAEAYATLGYVLMHDLFARQFGHGWDPAGCIAAYKMAKELDPKNTDYRIYLASAMEHNAEGERYASDAHLKDAVEEYRELRKVENANVEDANDRLVNVMAYAGQFRELRNELAEMNHKAGYNMMRVLSAAAIDGPAAAIKLAADITTGEADRSNILASAGAIAMRARMYAIAQALTEAGAAGQTNAGQMSNLASVLKQTRKLEDTKFDDNDPVSFSLHLSLIVRNAGHDWRKMLPYMSRATGELPGKWQENYLKQHWFRRTGVDLPMPVLVDIGMSVLKTAVEGDDAVGYRVAMQFGAVKTQYEYIVREDGRLKVLGETEDLVAVGQEALDRIARNDLKGAKVLLDWAREELKLAGGEDRFAGHPFPQLWSKGQDADAGRMRAAAAMLVTRARGALKPYADQIKAEREKATSDPEKEKLNFALMNACMNTSDWPCVEQSGKALLAAEASPRILSAVAEAMRQQKKWDDANVLVESLKAKLSDDMSAPRELARTLESRGDLAGAMKALKPYIENGKATTVDVNQYGWLAVMAGDVSPDVIQSVQQKVNQADNRSYAILHTLGCMYAEAGQVKQAQQTLLEALKADLSFDESDSIWYGYARLAESYGEYEAASKLYRKVEKPEFYNSEPSDTYTLAQNRLVLVGGKQGSAAAK